MSLSLDVDLLRSFVAIADARSLSRAAGRIGRTQSALSQQIRRLEAVIDHPLFERTGRGVVLTNPGERLLVHAQRILRLHDEAMADLCGKGLSGNIRFGCPDDYAAVFLPSLLRRFSSLHPQALVEVMCAPTPRLVEQLHKSAIDLAMVSLPLADTDDIIRREPLVWIGAAGLQSAHFDTLPLALSDPDTLDHRSACEALHRAGRAYRIAYASSSLSGLLAVVRSGQAVAVITRTAVPADLHVLDADPDLPPLPEVGITLKIAPSRPSPLTTAFAAHVRQMLPLL